MACVTGARRRVVLATRNEHKVHELEQLLGDLVGELGLEIVAVTAYPEVEDVAETEVTFVGNSLLKARAVAEATGLPTLADDSGLVVDVLGGCPGVFSARWSGSRAGVGASRAERDRANLTLLLEQVADVPDEHRRAAFACAAVVAMPDGRYAVAEGRVPGRLIREPRGSNGFGYDPIFVPDGQDGQDGQDGVGSGGALPERTLSGGAMSGGAMSGGAMSGGALPERTLAEYSDAEKNAISHRGRAFRALAADLHALLS